MSKATKSTWVFIVAALSMSVLQYSLYAQEAKFQQLDDADGIVCMEAENFSSQRESGGDSWWEFVEEPVDFSGTGAMQALPEGYEAHKDLADGQENAPVLQYAVDFVKAEPLYVWARSSHVDGYDDSIWFGLDELIEGTDPLSYSTDEQSYANESGYDI